MSGAIDRINGPHDGVVELVIVLQQDWESDPFLVKTLREKVAQYQEYLVSQQFRSSFANCRGVIVLEAKFFPPEEVQRILAKEGVEIRIASDISASAPPSPPVLVQSEVPQTVAPQPAVPQQAAPVQQPVPATASYGQPLAGQAASPQVLAPQAPAPMTEAYTQQPMDSQPESWEMDEDDFIPSGAGGGNSPMAYVWLGLLVVSALIALYGLVKFMSPPPEVSPRAVTPSTVSSQTLPKESLATISARPDRRAFAIVPIQDRAGKEQVKYHILFGVKESPKLLVFAKFSESQIPVRVEYKADPNDPETKESKIVWGKDLHNIPTRTYTGRLEHLQRFKGGPLELVLPGGNRDVNKLFRSLNQSFPMDSMILVVGEKPAPPSNYGGVLVLVGLLAAGIFGSLYSVQKRSAERSF